MIMKRLSFILLTISIAAFALLFLPVLPDYVYLSDAHAAHGAGATKSENGEASHELPGEVPFDRPVEEIQEFLAPMTELEIFPCSDCHDEDWEADTEKRVLDEPHDEIPGEFLNHDAENRWCLDCHSANKRDQLRLFNGTLIEFNEYYRLCEQCHKRIYREWKMGVHGKRTGSWNGEKEWMHCTQCHNPHNPPFKAVKPEPAPRTPLKVWSATAAEDVPSAAAQH